MDSSLFLSGKSFFVFGVLLFASFGASASSGQFILAPINQAVVAGDKVTFLWQLGFNLTRWTWSILRPSSIGNVETIAISSTGICSQPKFNDNFSHFRFFLDENSRCAMSTEAVKREDGGNYTFEYKPKNEDNSRQFSVQLTVLETLPRCENRSLLHGDGAIEFSCSVNFSGFWAPTMTRQMVLNNGQTVNISEEGNDVFRSNNSSSSSRGTVVISSDRLKSISRIKCKTHFTRREGDRLVMNASNDPDFVYTWTWSSADNDFYNTFRGNELPQEISLKLKVILVVASFSLMGFGVVVGLIIRRYPRRANRRSRSCAEYGNGCRESTSVLIDGDPTSVEAAAAASAAAASAVSADEQQKRIYVNLTSRDSLCAIQMKTLPVYEDIGHEYATLSLTWQSPEDEEEEAKTEEDLISIELQSESNSLELVTRF